MFLPLFLPLPLLLLLFFLLPLPLPLLLLFLLLLSLLFLLSFPQGICCSLQPSQLLPRDHRERPRRVRAHHFL